MGRNGPRHDGGPFALDAERDEPHGASGLRVGEFVLQSHASGICRRDVCGDDRPDGQLRVQRLLVHPEEWLDKSKRRPVT